MSKQSILGTRVDVTTYPDATARVLGWALRGEQRSVCAANVHVVMEARDAAAYRRVVDDADMVTSDGMPLVWTLRLMGWKNATRVYGPDLMLAVLAEAELQGVAIGLYGGAPETLEKLVASISRRFPGVRIAFAESPPFRPLSDREREATIHRMNASGAKILFVGLGCPKQEHWMAEHKPRVQAVLLGVGAAFDFLAGTKRQAPPLIRRLGFEWLFRLATEPRRLWTRYARHNPRYVAGVLRQVFRERNRYPRIQDFGGVK